MLEKTLESYLDCKEIKLVNPKGNQPWIFTGRTDAEIPILWPLDAKSWLIWKDLDAGKDWRQEEKGTTEDEMAGRHHRLNGYECEQALGGGEAWCATVHGVSKSQIQLSDWATTIKTVHSGQSVQFNRVIQHFEYFHITNVYWSVHSHRRYLMISWYWHLMNKQNIRLAISLDLVLCKVGLSWWLSW